MGRGRTDGRGLSDGVYRALLVAYPKEFRKEYAEEMVQSFRDLRRERRRGGIGLAALWLWAVFDLLKGATLERSQMFGALPVPLRVSGVSALAGGALLAAAVFLGVLFGTSGAPGGATEPQGQLAWATAIIGRLALVFMVVSLYLHIRRLLFRPWSALAISGTVLGVAAALFTLVALWRAFTVGDVAGEPGSFFKAVVEPFALWGMALSFVLVGLATLRVASAEWRWVPLAVGFLVSPLPLLMQVGFSLRIRSDSGAEGYVPFYVVNVVPTALAALACLALGYAIISGRLVRPSRESRVT